MHFYCHVVNTFPALSVIFSDIATLFVLYICCLHSCVCILLWNFYFYPLHLVLLSLYSLASRDLQLLHVQLTLEKEEAERLELQRMMRGDNKEKESDQKASSLSDTLNLVSCKGT